MIINPMIDTYRWYTLQVTHNLCQTSLLYQLFSMSYGFHDHQILEDNFLRETPHMELFLQSGLANSRIIISSSIHVLGLPCRP